MTGSLWLHRCGMGCHRHWCWGIPLDSWCGGNGWSLVHLGCWHCRYSRCGLHALCRWGQCRLFHWEVVSSQNLQCGSCATRDSVGHFDTAFTKVSLHAAVCGTIAGAYLIAVHGRTHITVVGIQIFLRVSYIATGWPAYNGTSVLLHLLACGLAASEHVSICPWTCMDDGPCWRSWPEWLFWVSIGTIALLGMEAWCWWESLRVLAGQAADQHCCTWLVGVCVGWTWCMPLQIHWIVGNADLRFCVLCPKIYRSWQTGHLHIVGHCQSEGLWGCHALRTSLSAARQPCWHCSGQMEYIKWRSSSSRNCQLPGSQLLLVWRYW